MKYYSLYHTTAGRREEIKGEEVIYDFLKANQHRLPALKAVVIVSDAENEPGAVALDPQTFMTSFETKQRHEDICNILRFKDRILKAIRNEEER